MITVIGNALETDCFLIAHQVNCMGIMGGGIAKQIKEKWPVVYQEYKDFIIDYEDCNESALGAVCYITVENHGIINIFGQENISNSECMTDYKAVRRAFEDFISNYRCSMHIPWESQVPIAIPYKFGCGLAGGDWNIMTEVLEALEEQENILFIAYKLE